MIYKLIFIIFIVTIESISPDEIKVGVSEEKSSTQAEMRIEKKQQIVASYGLTTESKWLNYQFNYSRIFSIALIGLNEGRASSSVDQILLFTRAYKLNQKKEVYYLESKFFFFEKFPLYFSFGGGLSKRYHGSEFEYIVINTPKYLDDKNSLYMDYNKISYSNSKILAYGIGYQYLFQTGLVLGFNMIRFNLLDSERTSISYSNYRSLTEISLINYYNSYRNAINDKNDNGFLEVKLSIGYAF